MLKYIPHSNNSHSWRTFLFIFFVMVISAGGAYLVNAYSGIFQKNTIPKEREIVQPISEYAVSQDTPDAVVESAPVIETVVTIVETPTLIPVALVEKRDPPVLVERNKNPETRQKEAKLYTIPRFVIGKYIDISLKYQNMVIFENGEALDAYIVSSGKKGLDTPTGTFRIENKSPRAWSKQYGLWMPNWMAFLPSGKMGIHELPVWPGGYQEGANHLGVPVSHGCVRLGVGSAKRVFDWAEIGTPVVIHE